jgi:hypothetical protein
MILREQLQIRDPFVFPMPSEQRYYLFGTTDLNPWNEKGQSFEAYISEDLIHFEGPHTVFSPTPSFWGTHDFWAPEVHFYHGKYHMFATFTSAERRRGTQILTSSLILGPYEPMGNHAVTPLEWECLDGTLFIDRDDTPWIVFCHEWVQVNDGTVCAMKLSEDLTEAVSPPIVLFHASEAPWPDVRERRDGSGLFDARVTDGPFLHRMGDGTLVMLWSSTTKQGYAMGQAHSLSGRLEGPWIQNDTPLIASDGGHGMVFEDMSSQLKVVCHAPNSTPHERLTMIGVVEDEHWLKKKTSGEEAS